MKSSSVCWPQASALSNPRRLPSNFTRRMIMLAAPSLSACSGSLTRSKIFVPFHFAGSTTLYSNTVAPDLVSS
jgi:hypothetical protein